MRDRSSQWYLGLDFGRQGLQASLVNHPHSAIYSLTWRQGNHLHSTYPLSLAVNPQTPPESWPLGFTTNTNTHGDKDITSRLDTCHHYLRLAPPFCRRQVWEPQVMLRTGHSVPLQALKSALTALILRVVDPSAIATHLAAETFRDAIQNLAGIVVACPHTWGATYRFNLRDVLLATRLVKTPDQVICVDAPIAIALAHQAQTLAQSEIVVQSQARITLSLYFDAQVTEAATWSETASPQPFQPQGAATQGNAYGHSALQADIFYRLLYPQWLPHHDFLSTMVWDFPRAGEPDFPRRDRATLQLASHPMGPTILTLAQQVLSILTDSPQVEAKLGHSPWQVTPAALRQEVWPGLMARLNALLNHLLSTQGQTSHQVRQLLWQPQHWQGLAPLIAPWLQRKFPQARCQPIAARLADGLALLPRFPGCLERRQHQYDDYFLLREVLSASPSQAFTLSQLCQNLRRQGLNPRDCRDRVQQLLNGYQPAGLLPDADQPWLTPAAQTLPAYAALRAAPLFTIDADNNSQFHCHERQRQRWQRYLAVICAHSPQTLSDPLLLPWRSPEDVSSHAIV